VSGLASPGAQGVAGRARLLGVPDQKPPTQAEARPASRGALILYPGAAAHGTSEHRSRRQAQKAGRRQHRVHRGRGARSPFVRIALLYPKSTPLRDTHTCSPAYICMVNNIVVCATTFQTVRPHRMAGNCTGAAMLDWDDLRYFLAVARHHTLAAAAQHLHVTQSTVSRRLASLQEGMGVRLLQRTADGYVLISAGESIHAHVERVEAEALLVESVVAGQDTRLEGLVRVASSQMLTSHLLAPCYAALHGHHSGILVEALPDMAGEPLVTNDTDIAVRLRRFEYQDLVVRSIGTLAFRLRPIRLRRLPGALRRAGPRRRLPRPPAHHRDGSRIVGAVGLPGRARQPGAGGAACGQL